MKTPIVVERFADNGAHSHWEMVCPDTGEKLAIEKMAPDEPSTPPAPDPRDTLIEQMGKELEDWHEAGRIIRDITYHSEGMGCGIEDRGITDRYQACAYGWDRAMGKVEENLVDDETETFAAWQKYKEAHS